MGRGGLIMHRRQLLLGLLGSFWCFSLPAAVPELLLANVYRDGIDLSAYLVSEKFDGVRAVWDGQALVSRAGHPIAAPAWFTAGWPKAALDGELWLARGQFERLSGIVRRETPNDAEWRQVRYLVFELPGAPGTFRQRVLRMQALVYKAHVPWLQVIEQKTAVDREHLQKMLDAVLKAGGEGLMLHRADALYETGRSDTLLKLKPWLDAEAVVIAHLPGKGKYEGQLGALQVRMPDGRSFRLGTGFSDAERRQPPPIGASVTYRYRELTAKGLPRFASFVRIRRE
jgi:DNA ligase-1